MKKIVVLLITAANIYSCNELDLNSTPLSLSNIQIPLPLLEQRRRLTEEHERTLRDIYRQFPNLQGNVLLNSSILSDPLAFILIKKSYGTSGLDALSKIIEILIKMGLNSKIIYHFSSNSKKEEFEIDGNTTPDPILLQLALSKNTYDYWFPMVKIKGGSNSNLFIELNRPN